MNNSTSPPRAPGATPPMQPPPNPPDNGVNPDEPSQIGQRPKSTFVPGLNPLAVRTKLDAEIAERLDTSLHPWLHPYHPNIAVQSRNVDIVQSNLRALIEEAKQHHATPEGQIRIFGSFSNGFKTGGSDLDVVYMSDEINTEARLKAVLTSVASLAPKYSFTNITKIFSANVPILKFSQATDDGTEGIEVDFCINNRLGVRNSDLLAAYSRCDQRVCDLGRLVKAWAKKKQLVGTADGYLNSYAYILMVIYFLQIGVNPPVLPNLQSMAKESYTTPDSKWGRDEVWETKFEAEPPNTYPDQGFVRYANKDSIGELLVQFFHFYKQDSGFRWEEHAVCMRLADATNGKVDKYTLMQEVSSITNSNPPPLGSDSLANVWYIEDPFDLKHNLAGKCSPVAKQKLFDEFQKAYDILSKEGNMMMLVPPSSSEEDFSTQYLLKCRINQTSASYIYQFMDFFDDCDISRLHVPKVITRGRYGMAFLEFPSSAARRKAHAKNESYIGDCQLQIHYSTMKALEETAAQTAYQHFDYELYQQEKKAGKVFGNGSMGEIFGEKEGMLPAAPPPNHHHKNEAPPGYMYLPNGQLVVMPPEDAWSFDADHYYIDENESGSLYQGSSWMSIPFTVDSIGSYKQDFIEQIEELVRLLQPDGSFKKLADEKHIKVKNLPRLGGSLRSTNPSPVTTGKPGMSVHSLQINAPASVPLGNALSSPPSSPPKRNGPPGLGDGPPMNNKPPPGAMIMPPSGPPPMAPGLPSGPPPSQPPNNGTTAPPTIAPPPAPGAAPPANKESKAESSASAGITLNGGDGLVIDANMLNTINYQ